MLAQKQATMDVTTIVLWAIMLIGVALLVMGVAFSDWSPIAPYVPTLDPCVNCFGG